MEESTLKFTWKIKDFSKIQTQGLYSDVFSRGPYKWKLFVSPKGEDGGGDHLSIYLGVADETLPTGCCRNAKFSFTVVNQVYNNLSRKIDAEHGFDSYFNGFSKFISLKELHNPHKGFLVEDTCIIEVHVTIYGDVFMGSPSESKETSKKKVDDPVENSTDQVMDAFFLELQSVISAKRAIPSQEEEEKEALAMIEEAASNMDVNNPGGMSKLKDAFDVLFSLKECTLLTPEQKAELLSVKQNFIDSSSPQQAAKGIKDIKLFTQKELVMPILDWKLRKCLNEFEKARAETMKSEQNIAILQEQVESRLAEIGETKKKIESSSLKQKERFELSKEVKDELDVLVKNWPEYEAKKKAAEEEEKIVGIEWDKMKQLVTSLTLKKPSSSPSMEETYWDKVKQLVLSLKKPFYPSLQT